MLGGEQPHYREELPDEEVEHLIDLFPNGVPVEVIASQMGLTTERVRQILRKALLKLQRVCERREIDLSCLPPERTTVWDRLGAG